MPVWFGSGQAKILAAVIYTAVVFAAGWMVNGWRIDAGKVKDRDNTIVSMQTNADAVNALELDAINRKEAADAETNRIMDGVADERISLRIEAKCVHDSADASSAEEATAELSGQSRRWYQTHRKTLIEAQENLRLCIEYAQICDAARGH